MFSLTTKLRSLNFKGLSPFSFSKESLVLTLLFILGGSSVLQSQTLSRKVFIDEVLIRQQLANAPSRTAFASYQDLPTITLPMPEGGIARFSLFESPIIGDLNTRIRSYTGRSLEDPTCLIRVNVSPRSVYAILQNDEGFTEIRKQNDNQYTTTLLEDNHTEHGHGHHSCDIGTKSHTGISRFQLRNSVPQDILTNSCFQIGSQLRKYEMAVGVTKEYASLYNNNINEINDEIAARLADLNLIYERDAAIQFSLIASNDLLITPLLSASDDDITNPEQNSTATLNESSEYIDDILTTAGVDYDLGHYFHAIDPQPGNPFSFGGIAGIGVVCNNSLNGGNLNRNKARGYTIFVKPLPGISVKVFAHEVGHQFDGLHTNYGCGTEDEPERYEPGQGSTIMSTPAGCDADPRNTFQSQVDDFFSVESLSQINEYIANSPTCEMLDNTGNTPPTANANPTGATIYIPMGTPFTLTGFASDPDQEDVLTYSWEQIDQDLNGSFVPSESDDVDGAPLFRVRNPTTSPSRTFPALESILNDNDPDATGEVLPTIARTMNFAFLVRDNCPGGGGSACDNVAVEVTNDGPFTITSQNTSANLSGGQTITVNWDEAGTNTGNINCAAVDILISYDGGYTFDAPLVDNTPNDGSQAVTLPNTTSNLVRIKVACSDNIFFDINDADLSITSTNGCLADGGVIFPAGDEEFLLGSASLNLGLGQFFANGTFSEVAVDYDNTAPSLNFVARETNGDCKAFAAPRPYQAVNFYVAADGDYTFSLPSSNPYLRTITIFDAASFDPLNGCLNDSYVGTNTVDLSGVGNLQASTSVTVTLTAGTEYLLALYRNGLSDNNYTLTASGTGLLYISATNPGSNFGYTYIAVDAASRIIKAVSSTSDFQSLPTGAFEIYGVSFKDSGASPPSLVNSNNFLNRSIGEVLAQDGCLVNSVNNKPIKINCSNPQVLDLKVFLQGAFDTGTESLTTSVRTLDAFPESEPYSSAPWNFTVTENPGACIDPLALAMTSPVNLILADYIYVELRSTPAEGSFVTSKVGLLRQDGTIVNLNGTPFTICVASGSYYILVKHRNHLGVMTGSTISIP